jgi:Spy/CpxP family protein refolding chaperone
MIRRLLFAAAAFAVSLLAASPAEAQLNLRGLRFPASLQNIFLLRGDAVQTELALKDEQKTAISELALALQQEAFEIMSGLQDLTPEEQKEQMPEVMKMIAEKGTEIQGKVDEILVDEQKARLKELSVQARGPQALEDDEISAALKITDEQKKKLEEVREEGNAAMQEAMTSLRAGGGDQGKMREKMGAMRKELSEKALAVLTPEQKEQFEKLKGKEFKFPSGRGGGGLPF